MMSPAERAAIEGSVTYSGCDEVRALGRAPIHEGEPGYRVTMDGDADGVACEPWR
ncbi:MAG: excalibur calcium-binding domain-containing protein [Erythrobacter sp.]|nr:MAG: excalibur calcium-binding domain-containing protein [Erythrobacter sp.]